MVRFAALSALVALLCGLCVLALPTLADLPDGVYTIELPAKGYFSLREADKAEFCTIIPTATPGEEQKWRLETKNKRTTLMSEKYGKYITVNDFREGTRLVPTDKDHALEFELYADPKTSRPAERRIFVPDTIYEVGMVVIPTKPIPLVAALRIPRNMIISVWTFKPVK
ncbi:hypothetical protein BDV93DRAFT_513243 [Ceratobasidium sp. AG-I]|nr:hypothetical protein BDV93DRAFT_513243 [Ceratobasidium sp. AG-I]